MSELRFSQWASVTPTAGWVVDAGPFTGAAGSDLFGYHPGNGTLWVAENRGDRFAFTHPWATVNPADGWQFVVADVTGNGRADIVGYHPSNGTVWVGENRGDGFALAPWATLAPAAGWVVDCGLFTGHARADLLAYHRDSGSLWVGENTGDRFALTEQAPPLRPAAGWQVVAGSVNGDLWDDVVAYQPGNGSVWVGVSPTRPIEGYCWPLSARPGESVSFHLSHDGEAVASIQRHTSTSETIHSAEVRSVAFTAEHQVAPTTAWRDGCGWEETFGLTVQPEWPSGIYSAACTDSTGGGCDITFVVKPAEDRRSRIAVLANVNTWLAYNGWGSRSKYSGAARTSFLRPMPNAAPDGDLHLTRGELWILGWLEREGHSSDVFTDIDFHDDGCDPEQYPLLLVGTHPEYWTPQMYDRLASYLDAGGSLAYLGGDGLFETGEYDDDRTEVVFRLGVEGGPREAALFRVLGRAERSLLGVATERCAVPGSPYVVRADDHPLFAGTGRSNGDPFGEAGLNRDPRPGTRNGKASGWEVDTSRGRGATGLPTICDLDEANLPPTGVPPSALPDGLVVLAQGRPDGTAPGADMTYYDHPGGGFVFSAGSITFGGSLVVDAALSTLVHNAIHRAGLP